MLSNAAHAGVGSLCKWQRLPARVAGSISAGIGLHGSAPHIIIRCFQVRYGTGACLTFGFVMIEAGITRRNGLHRRELSIDRCNSALEHIPFNLLKDSCHYESAFEPCPTGSTCRWHPDSGHAALAEFYRRTVLDYHWPDWLVWFGESISMTAVAHNSVDHDLFRREGLA